MATRIRTALAERGLAYARSHGLHRSSATLTSADHRPKQS